MSKLEFNKEGLLLLAKKITSQNYSFPKIISLKTNQIQFNPILYNSFLKENNNLSTKDYIVNFSEEKINFPFKNIIKLKNKFLEKNNIPINEEKIKQLLSKKKEKLKLSLSQGNNKIANIHNNKIIYINMDKYRNNINNNITHSQKTTSKDIHHKNKRIIKCYTRFEKSNTYNENLYNNINENGKIISKKLLLNSKSGYFNNNLLKNFLSDRKSMKFIGKNINLNLTNSFINNNISKRKLINYSRNKENNKLISNQFYSIKNINKNNVDKINKDHILNDDDYKYNNKRINNNININININNSINGNINNIKKLENNKFNERKKYSNKYIRTNKCLSYRKKGNKISNQTDINDINNNTDYKSLIEDSEKNYINSSDKIMKKDVSDKMHYLKDIKKYNKINEEEFEEKDNNEKYKFFDKKNEREMTYEGNEKDNKIYMDYNIYNINVNFFTDRKDNFSKINDINGGKNFKFLNSGNSSSTKKRIGSKSCQKKEEGSDKKNIGFYESSSNNIQKNESQMIKNSKNEIKDKIIDNNLDSISKLIQRKYHKQKQFSSLINELNYTNKTNQNNLINKKKYKDTIIQIEDLLILEGKFCHLINYLKYENLIPKICVEWWNFYNYSSFYGKFPKLFPKTNIDNNTHNNYMTSDYQIAHDTAMYELLSMIIAYKILCCSPSNKTLINNLISLINEVNQNFLIECDYILSKVSSQSLSNLWIKKLKNIILDKKNWDDKEQKKINNFHLTLLMKGNNRIQNLIQYLINSYEKDNSNKKDSFLSLAYYCKNIQKISLIELRGFFNKSINKEKAKITKAFSYLNQKNINNKSKFISIVAPYLPEEIEDKKNYTLVLDLDETLISFRFDEKGRGLVKMRPGLFNFLKKVKTKYEIIVFTAGTQEYADPILDSIEKKNKFFAKRLYRQHTILMNNIYIKDLTKLGRDLSKIIIVDNMPQNFSLQKENGILISNYFGQDNNETTLNDLSLILLKIALNPKNDVRKELSKYREEIFTKITTNLKC